MTVNALEQYDRLRAVDFDCPFLVGLSGTIYTGADVVGIHAPEVYHDDETDVWISPDIWEPLTGYTGQHGYRGAVMHSSEQLSGRLADDILATPGAYVIVAVEVLPDDDDTDPAPAGWAVLRLKEKP